MASPDDTPRTLRWLLWLAGTLSLGLGIVGIVVPGLPTTPFVLLAAACYAKASPRLHGWLRSHRFFGPMVRDWEAHRSLTRRTKRFAQVTMLVMVSLSAWGLRDRPVLLAVMLVAAAVGVWVVARIPTRQP
ncbi:MAG: YbaN family protein [Hydrogenophaga sp.]|uniref:YbaN family protein n=1 Tax=Hydrogenophaga sp. TaxID=1904254 RepID=UPI001DCC6D4F|nr:YbaN family protein [Hydrogenophaga sp.]MBX3608395.1 YbaN family protein [Hydrogenophaga sp.]